MTAALPREWVRGVQWAAGSRSVWEPILRAAQAAWSELELVSVSEGLRSSALIRIESEELARACADTVRVGLYLSVLDRSPDGSFRAAIHAKGASDLRAEWYRDWAASDHDAVGRMLGFPDWIVYCFMVPPIALTALIALVQALVGFEPPRHAAAVAQLAA